MKHLTALVLCSLTTLAATAQTPVAPMPTAAPAPDAAASAPLYTVVDGVHVDAETMKGFRTWRAAACDRCHGANQEGLVGPALVESLKVLTKEQFVTTVTNGRLEKGMPSFSTATNVIDNIDHLYAYLKGRSDGAITKAKVDEIK
jgi:mono/diheme cytochrome c family protein